MNQLAVLASETHEQAIAYFKVAEQYGYKFIMEVKKIRDDRLYKEIGFSNFNDYCEKAWNVDRTYIDQRIVIADSLGNESNFEDTYPRLGHSKSLLLARMEPEVREQIEATVDVNDLTVKKLSQLEKQLQQIESEKERLSNESHHYKKLWDKEKDKPAQVIYKTDESKTKQLEHTVKTLQDNLSFVKKQLDSSQQLQDTYKKNAKEYEELKKKIDFLHKEKSDLHRQIESATALSGLTVEIDNFIKTKLAPIRYSRSLERLDSEVAVNNLTEIIESVEHWCEDMRHYLPKNNRKVVIDYDSTG